MSSGLTGHLFSKFTDEKQRVETGVNSIVNFKPPFPKKTRRSSNLPRRGLGSS
jgi:hypothetical protein